MVEKTLKCHLFLTHHIELINEKYTVSFEMYENFDNIFRPI